MKQHALWLVTFSALTAVASAQATLTTVAPADSAIDWTSDFQTILVSGFSDWATVDVSSGTRTPLPAGGDFPVAISDNGFVLGDMDDPGTGNSGSGLCELTSGTWIYLGNMPGAVSGCPDLSSPYDLDDAGAVAVGLGWDGCSARAFEWQGATGMTQLPQLGTSSTRANVVSADGQTIGGWDRATTSSNQASVWYPDGTELLVNQTPANPIGIGETWGLSSDGTWACGSGLNGVGPFLFSQATGTIEIGVPAGGSTSGTTAFAVSDDGKVVIGYEGNFLGSRAWIWTCSGGSEWLDDYLAARGVTLPGNIGTAIRISPDGTKILGTWDTGGFPSTKNAFIAEIPAQPTWAQYDVGVSPVNLLDLDGGGSTGLGQTFTPSVTGVPVASTLVASGISSGPSSLPLFGGIVLIDPGTLIASLLEFPAGAGGVTHTIPIPPSTTLWGVSVSMQSLADDLTQPQGWALSNGLTVSL